MNEEVKEARTEWVAPSITFIPQDHDWMQTNAVELTCTGCKFRHGTSMPMGKTLIGERGKWEFIDTPVARQVAWCLGVVQGTTEFISSSQVGSVYCRKTRRNMSDEDIAVNESVEQETTAPESAPEETKELEVVREGDAVEPILHEQSETEGEEDQVKSDDSEAEETKEEKPLGEKGLRRNQQLANENRELKQYIQKLESDQPPLEKYNIKEAIQDKGLTPEQARIEAIEHNLRLDKQERTRADENRQLQDLNVAVRTDAENLTRDFPGLTANDSDTNMLMDAWHQVARVEYMTNEDGQTITAPDGAPVIKQADFSLYDFANIIDHFASSRQKQGETQGQKAAEKNLSAVEVRPSTKPKQTNTNDSSLSADAYAKKYNLSVAR